MSTVATPEIRSTPGAAKPRARQSLRKILFPNTISATIFGLGVGLEVAFASQVSTHALWAGGPAAVMSVTFLLWFWITVARCWAARARHLANARQSSDQSSLNLRSRLVSITWFLITYVTLLGYIISWGICLQTGRFANWDTLWFALANWKMLWDYLLAADQQQLALLLAIGVAVAFVVPWCTRRMREYDLTPTEEASNRLRPLMVWLILGIVTLWTRAKICDDLSVPRQVDRMHRVATALNPIVTLGTSLWQHFTAEPIWPCLDETQLVSRDIPWMASSEMQKETSEGRRLPSVIIIAVESLRHDMIGFVHQGREVLPHTNHLARNGLHLTRAYAQSTHSDYADLCLVSSLYPLRSRSHHFYRHDDPWPKVLLHDLLKERGYQTAIISSQNEAWGGMDQFLMTSQLDLFYHPERSDVESMVSERDPGFYREHLAGTLVAGKFPDRHTTDVAIEWIRGRVAADEPYCLSMNFQSSHFPYLMPEDTPRPFQPCELADDVKFSSYPVERTDNVRNAYYNGIHECDRQIGRVIELLEELETLDDTIIVVTGENGEAFHENGCVGHAGLPVEPVVRVAAILHAPNYLSARQEDYPFEHVDLVPTLLAIMGLPTHPNLQGRDILAADRPAVEQRLIYFHVISPIARADAVLLAGRWKWVVSHERPDGQLYDIEMDPSESLDVSDKYPELVTNLANRLAIWRRNQLAYYHYPTYYLRYFPPSPPDYPSGPKTGQ